MKNLLSASLPENNSREAVADVAYISNLGEIEAPEVKFHLPVTVSSCDKEAGPPAEVQSSLTNASEAVLVMVKCPASNETEVTWPSGVSPMWPTSMPLPRPSPESVAQSQSLESDFLIIWPLLQIE